MLNGIECRPHPEQHCRASRVVGTGAAQAHWGELIQGPVLYLQEVITGVITLPRADLYSTAIFHLEPGPEIRVYPHFAEKAQRAVRHVLNLAERQDLGGTLVLRSNINCVGTGAGSSTSNVVAAIRAAKDAIRFPLDELQVQALTHKIEGASDPLALCSSGQVVIYGSRTGHLIRQLPHPLPAMCCLGFNSAPGRMVITDTLIGSEGYTDDECERFKDILAMAEESIVCGRAERLAQAATDSARLNQHRVPTRNFEALYTLCREFGGFGVSVSHSGTVGAMLMPPGIPTTTLERLSQHLSCAGCSDLAVFRIGTHQESFSDLNRACDSNGGNAEADLISLDH